jgi:hypothetical protein
MTRDRGDCGDVVRLECVAQAQNQPQGHMGTQPESCAGRYDSRSRLPSILELPHHRALSILADRDGP